jgi:hypothetical protein
LNTNALLDPVSDGQRAATLLPCTGSIQPASAELAAAALDEIEEIAGIGDNLYALRDQHEQTLRQRRAIADKA